MVQHGFVSVRGLRRKVIFPQKSPDVEESYHITFNNSLKKLRYVPDF